ncbi:MAG: hypothetical protein KUG81_03525 [Gammaproteobacteria bacterium]|nr:hypothetical protein [Gammaproteobacteria bacterium]
MAAQESTFSIAYDRQQDRLTLTLQGKGVQLEGKMTRRLLLGFIKGLPTWLDQQDLSMEMRGITPQLALARQHSSPRVDLYKPDTSQNAERSPEVHVPDSVACFLIEIISLSTAAVDDGTLSFRLQFLSADKKGAIALDLSNNEFLAVIKALVDNGEGWDLVYPWLGLATGQDWSNKTHSLH